MDSFLQKAFGYILLMAGLICILFTVFSIHQVFTNTLEPPDIFKMNSFSFTTASDQDKPAMQFTIPLKTEVRKIVNMLLFYMLMLFIVTVGAKVGSLGIQLIKDIKIELKK